MAPLDDELDEMDEQPAYKTRPVPKTAGEDGEQEELSVDSALPYRLEKRPARLDITKSSKEDHRWPMRFTKRELEDQLDRDYKYAKQKSFMMIQPFMVMLDYPYKKNKSDSDVPDKDGKNVDVAPMLVIGRLPRFKSVEEYKNEKSYVMGEIMYVRRGLYYVPESGETVSLKPHFAMVIRKRRERKKIKPIDVRELFDPIKNELQNGKPFVVYKELPILKKLEI